MDFLLDTHALIWFVNGDKSLPHKSQEIIKDTGNRCYVSIASIWEIAIKVSLNKLELNGGFDEISKIIVKHDFEILPISIEHVAAIIDLEFHHRDPFDRIIISQGMVESIPVITKDKNFGYYNIAILWE
ncbi:MAG: type II toxin-antitoxin system VapC family toxin [bacterium]